MCGLIGIVSKKFSNSLILKSLERLEYRGYDSAGIAVISDDSKINVIKSVGSVANLVKKAGNDSHNCKIGIAHTRWATHGAVTVENAHPQFDGMTAVVHNGIIENFAELKQELDNCDFLSQTDTEVITHLISKEVKNGHTFLESVSKTIRKIKGTFALAILNINFPNMLVIAKRSSPVYICNGNEKFDNSFFIASDTIAVSDCIENYTELNDDEICVIEYAESLSSCNFFDSFGKTIEKKWKKFENTQFLYDKGDFEDFTSKEINEQPIATSKMLDVLKKGGFKEIVKESNLKDEINFVACGSSFYASLVGKYIFEKYCRIKVSAEVASEFRYRSPVVRDNSLPIFISQSGETIDTFCAQEYVKKSGFKTFLITNVSYSSMAKVADFVWPLNAGPEFGVVSTKAFTAQLFAISCFAIEYLKQKDLKLSNDLLSDLEKVPSLMSEIIERFDELHNIASHLLKSKNVLFIGRGINYPIAMESALKFKEISYIYAQGYPAGELKHGPIALIDEFVSTVVIAPFDDLFEKVISNVQEIVARNGKIVLLTDQKGSDYVNKQNISKDQITIFIAPETGELSKLFVYTVIGQIIAYNVARIKGCNVDRPRNLAKSVTVE